MSFSTEFLAPLTHTVPCKGPDECKTKRSTARQYCREQVATEASFGCENSPLAGAPQAIVDTVSDKRQLPDRDLAVGLVRVTADHQLSELREFSAIELG
jgi:hypothetical protein